MVDGGKGQAGKHLLRRLTVTKGCNRKARASTGICGVLDLDATGAGCVLRRTQPADRRNIGGSGGVRREGSLPGACGRARTSRASTSQHAKLRENHVAIYNEKSDAALSRSIASSVLPFGGLSKTTAS